MRAWFLLVVSGCVLSASKPPPAQDGTACSANTDCESDDCQGNVCIGGGCSKNTDCGENGACLYSSGDPLFGIGAGYYCHLECDAAGACPAQYMCNGGECDYVGPKVTVTYSPMEIRGRMPEDFTVTLDPPLHATFTWHIVPYPSATNPIDASGATIEETLDPGSYTVHITAMSGTSEVASYDDLFNVCYEAGDATSDYTFCCSGLTWDPTTHVCN